MNYSKVVVWFSSALLLAFLALGCQNDFPVSTVSDPDVQVEPAASTGAVAVPSSPVIPIALPAGLTVKPVVTTSMDVTPLSGGTLEATMSYISATTRKPVMVHAVLQVPAGGVNGVRTITMTIDTSVVGVQFGPKGLRFGASAVLTLEATNVDELARETTVGFYYFDDKDNSEPQAVANIRVGANNVSMKGGRVPHFSRYAFGRKFYRAYNDRGVNR